MVALNVQTKKRWWFWMSNYGEMMTLNAWMWERRLPERLKLRRDSGSECQTEERWWLWTPNWKYDDDGPERQNWKCDSQRQAENAMMALIAETEKWRWWFWMPKLKMWWWWLWMPNPKMWWWWLWVPKLKMQLWMSNWKCDDDGSECWNEE